MGLAKKRKSFIVTLLFLTLISGCGLIFFIDGTYYYAPWLASVDSTGCLGVDTSTPRDGQADISMKKILVFAGQAMTVTTETFTDTSCVTLDSTITENYTIKTGAYIDSTRIYYDYTTNEYLKWSEQVVPALALDITYTTASLNCVSDTCVTGYNMLIALNNCSSGTLIINQDYDYTTCQFANQPGTLYTLIYRSNLDDIVFGASHVLSSETTGSFAGDTEANRHKYLYVNERYSLK